MLRKTKKRLFSRRVRSKSELLMSNSGGVQQSVITANVGESESSRIFREVFIEKFNAFKDEAELLVNGIADVSDTWKDVLGTEGIGLSSAVIAGIIGLLGGLCLLSVGLTAGLSIGIAVVGVGIGIGYYKYREYVKQKRFDRATESLDRDDFSGEVEQIAQSLASMYRLQLQSSTIKDANYLADACMKAISQEMLKNKEFVFDELLFPSTLQGVLMRAGYRAPKVRLDMNLMSDKKFNTRGMIRHTAFYCKETNEFYKSSKSKGRKYGVLYFDKKSDLDEYQEILSSTMKHADKWRLRKMRPYESSILKRSSLFKAFKNDDDFKRTPLVEALKSESSLKMSH